MWHSLDELVQDREGDGQLHVIGVAPRTGAGHRSAHPTRHCELTVPDSAHGVFETLLVRDGRIQALDRHLARLRASVAELYGRPLPDRLAATVGEPAAGLSGSHRLRLDVVPEGDGLTATVAATALDPDRPRRYALTPVTVAGGHGPHKWRDRRALEAGGGVPLLVDEDGLVLEAAWANVWLLDGRQLSTPPADGRLLAGVTRARLLELAPSLGLEATQRPISLDEARAAPAVVLTSSLALAVAAAVDDEPGPGNPAIDKIRLALERGDWEDPPRC
jgi:para-aminobenzoate synthetase / 4-amino-4-deoxychorismate lyase